ERRAHRHDALDRGDPPGAGAVGRAGDVDRRAVAARVDVVREAAAGDHVAGVAERLDGDLLDVHAVAGEDDRRPRVEGERRRTRRNGRSRRAGRTGRTGGAGLARLTLRTRRSRWTGRPRRAGRAGLAAGADGERVLVALALAVAGGDGEQIVAVGRQAAGADEVAGDRLRRGGELRRAQRRHVADLAEPDGEPARRPEVVAGD